MTDPTYFVHKESGHKTKGVPISAMLQCRDEFSQKDKFTLYESLEGHGFFLRKDDEFKDRFRVVHGKKEAYWVHKAKGGNYRVIATGLMWVGSPSNPLTGAFDSHEMKVYYMDGNHVKHGLFCAATQFSCDFEPRYVVKWLDKSYEYVSSHSIPFEPPKGLITDEGFITVYRDNNGPFYNALVSREGCKDVRVRGDELKLVMSAAAALLHGKA